MLELSTRTGCQLKNTTRYGVSSVCSGRQRFTPGPAGPAAGAERQIIVAIDNCRVDQLVASYRVEMYGFVCNAAAFPSLPSPLGGPVHPGWNWPLPAAVLVVLTRPLLGLAVLAALASSTGRRLTPS